MRRIFRIDGVPVLNFVELQKRFAPLAIYEELKAFDSFAAVHCVPLPLQLRLEQGEKAAGVRYNAAFLTKQFWHGVLHITVWPQPLANTQEALAFLKKLAVRPSEGYQSKVKNDFLRDLAVQLDKGDEAEAQPKAIIDSDVLEKAKILKALAAQLDKGDETKAQPKAIIDSSALKKAKIGPETLAQAIGREIRDAQLEAKLGFISDAAEIGDDLRRGLLLLAICELAEIDPRRTDAGEWHRDAAEEREEQETIPEFPYEKTAYLIPGKQVYRYLYHDEPQLAPGERIRTVRVGVKKSINHDDCVRIELYSEAQERCVQTVELHSGEHRYCNVSRGRIIQFLPTKSSGEGLYLEADAAGAGVRVIPDDAESWTLNAENVSCMSAGSRAEGFLMVQNGMVNFMFFKSTKDYLTRMQLEMMPFAAVEVLVANGDYEVLLEDGTTLLGSGGKGRTGVAALNTRG